MNFNKQFSETPVPFICEHCFKKFSGIFKHYKRLGSKNISFCRQCYDANNQFPAHNLESCGLPFQGSVCGSKLNVILELSFLLPVP